MNAPHIHLLINHLPIIGLIIGILVLIFGLFGKKQVVLSVGLWITLIAGFSSYPTMFTGGSSEHFFEENKGKYCVSEDLIHEHEEAAELAFWPCIVTGVFAGLALIGNRKGHKHTKKAEILVVFIGIIAIILIGKAGLTGGQIRHPEISSCCSAEESAESCKGMSGHAGCSGMSSHEGCTYMNSEKCTASCMPGCKHDGTDACCKGDTTSQMKECCKKDSGELGQSEDED
jgi:uncharacterized membrane protein